MAAPARDNAQAAQMMREAVAGLRSFSRWPDLEPGEDLANAGRLPGEGGPGPGPGLGPGGGCRHATAGQLADEAGPMVLHADGGSRGNPGPAGAGAALLDVSGGLVAAWHRYLGKTTNNVAEYQALILGLEGAADLGVRHLLVRLDSELLIRQLQGRYQVKSPHLKPLFEQARQLTRSFASIKFQHISREQNAIADRLANLAMDQGSVPGLP
ncbi:ribonuclease HI [Desulfarculales bacterium]